MTFMGRVRLWLAARRERLELARKQIEIMGRSGVVRCNKIGRYPWVKR